jgi:drug/metabolite transporter (DMT)-like permease
MQFTFAGFHVFGKYVIGHIPPLALASTRVLVATPLLFLMAWLVDRTLPRLKDLPILALLGLLGVTLNQILFIVGLNYTTATNAAIFMPSIPVFAAGAAVLLGVERMSPLRLVGVLFAVGGALTMLDFADADFSKGPFFGNLLILTNCFCYSLFLVLQRPILKRLPPLTVIAWAFGFGAIGVLAVGGPTLMKTQFSDLPNTAWIGLAYIVLIPTTLNYALATWAIRHSTPSLVATYTTLQPVGTAILAALFLAETFGVRQVAGFVLIMIGLYIVSLVRSKEAGSGGRGVQESRSRGV